MAFCNSCGASISAGTRFCSKCGAPILASSPTPGTVPSAAAGSTMPAASSPPVPAQGGGALKAILIVVGVIVLAGILGVASLGFFAWRFARHAHVRQDGDNVTVETPFGSVQTTRDPEEAARALGVDLYPGAEVSKMASSPQLSEEFIPHRSTPRARIPSIASPVFTKQSFPTPWLPALTPAVAPSSPTIAKA